MTSDFMRLELLNDYYVDKHCSFVALRLMNLRHFQDYFRISYFSHTLFLHLVDISHQGLIDFIRFSAHVCVQGNAILNRHVLHFCTEKEYALYITHLKVAFLETFFCG